MNLGMKLLQIRKGWGLGVKFTRKLMGQETPLQTLVTRVSFSLQKSHSMHRATWYHIMPPRKRGGGPTR